MSDQLPPLPPSTQRPYSPAPQGRGGTSAWRTAAIILILVLLLSLFGNVSSWFFTLFSAPPGSEEEQMEEILVRDHGSQDKIALIDVAGIISTEPDPHFGFSQVELIRKQFERAGRSEQVKAVVLNIDSPGGEVLAADEIANSIQKFQKRYKKPVIASMGATAASGGYYVAAPCHWIVANELTLTGSIGVLMYGFNFRELMDKVGVRPEIYTSGKLKTMLGSTRNPQEVSQEERRLIQNLVDETFERFKKVIVDGRGQGAERIPKEGRLLSQDWQTVADGRILSGKQAYQFGLVDELGNFETALQRARTEAKIPNANLVRFQPPLGFSNLFRLFGKSEAPKIKVDVGLNLPRLQAGRLYFLPASLFH